MSFQKKQYNQKDIIDLRPACPIQTEEQLAIYLRKNFSIPANIYRYQLFQNYTQKLKQVSILNFYLLDNIFFKPLCDFLDLNNIQIKILIQTKQMQNFIETVLCKLKLFDELVLQKVENSIDQRINLSEGCVVLLLNQKSIKNLRNKLINQTKEKLFQYSLKLIEIYETKTKKSWKLRVSKSHPNYKSTKEDNQFSLILTEQLLNQGQILGKYQIEKFSSTQKFKNRLTPVHSYHQFLQKILYLCNFAYQIITQNLKMLFPQKISDQSKVFQNKKILKSQQGDLSSTTDSEQSKRYPIQKIKTPRSLSNKIIQKDQKYYQVQQKFAKNIAIQRPLCARCLNCVQYFYSGFPVYTERNHLGKCTILNSINMIKDCPDVIRQVIGGMVNNGGGTILFGCKKVNFGFIPIGQYVILKEQESLKSSFENLFKCIVPQSYQKLFEYKIDFIPLKQSPLDSDGRLLMNNFSHKIERSFILQHYIMRVKITPKSQKQIFLCQIDKTVYFLTLKDSQTVVDMKDEGLYEEIKKRAFRFTDFKSKQNFDRIEKQMGKQSLTKIIRGKRQPLQNLHEGPCLDTLTLSLNFVK